MRIGIDACCWGNRRGFGRFSRELLQALIEVDKANEYIFFIDSENEEADAIPEGPTKVVASTSISPVIAASADGNRRLADIWAMTREVLRHKIDIFFFPAVYSYFPILNRTKVVVAIHDVIADHHPQLAFSNSRSKWLWKLKQNVAVRQANLIATVSEYSKRQIVDYFRLPESRLRIITEGAKPVFKVLPKNNGMLSARSKYGLRQNENFLLYVGGISPHKNLGRLIDAFGISQGGLADKSLKLLLVGDHNDDPFLSEYPALKKKIEDLGLNDSVRFTGFVGDEDLAYLYNAASAVVLPSLEEGFGLPALEAMACGAPVIASDRGSLPEVLGEAARYFEPQDVQNIAETILSILNNDRTRTEMSESGLKRARDFGWQKAAADTLKIFDELAG
jgi:glycosyltransferase involved in cell wall biosynthesis